MDIFIALVLVSIIAVCCMAWASRLINEVVAQKHRYRALKDALAYTERELKMARTRYAELYKAYNSLSQTNVESSIGRELLKRSLRVIRS